MGFYKCCKDCSTEKRNLIREETGHDCHTVCETYLKEKMEASKLKASMNFDTIRDSAREHLNNKKRWE